MKPLAPRGSVRARDIQGTVLFRWLSHFVSNYIKETLLLVHSSTLSLSLLFIPTNFQYRTYTCTTLQQASCLMAFLFVFYRSVSFQRSGATDNVNAITIIARNTKHPTAPFLRAANQSSEANQLRSIHLEMEVGLKVEVDHTSASGFLPSDFRKLKQLDRDFVYKSNSLPSQAQAKKPHFSLSWTRQIRSTLATTSVKFRVSTSPAIDEAALSLYDRSCMKHNQTNFLIADRFCQRQAICSEVAIVTKNTSDSQIQRSFYTKFLVLS